jgi:hypothetical protein
MSDQGSPWTVRGSSHRGPVAAIAIVTTVVAIGIVLWLTLHHNGDVGSSNTITSSPTSSLFPVGIANSAEPSGMAPPPANALGGFVRTYTNDFNGTNLPYGWYAFNGVPGGLPGGEFVNTNVKVGDGLLQLETTRDPAFGNRWVTGGLCQCALGHTFGAFFVRSRITGPGPNDAELLWPKSNVWPPEIDFNESGGSIRGSSSTVHYGIINMISQTHVSTDMAKWHTWGVIWTPNAITVTLDGHVWALYDDNYEIARVPMTLDFEQRASCDPVRNCPQHPSSMLIDWVAEYSLK